MAGKTPGTPRKSSSRKSAGKQKMSTPIGQGEVKPAKNAVTAGSQSTENAAASSTQKTVTPISQGTGSTAEARKYGSVNPPSGLDEEIRRRAYELFEARGRQHGFHHDDWSRAEAEVRSRFKREKSA